ncbi:MAG TPA: PAS domain-containing protein [Candidatus Dorea intestinavium]|nr:PAS domain-containing protein [Candidatus Dorea intestinavium]
MHKLMEWLTKMIEFLGIALGEDCEIVLQDINHGIIAIANGHVSNRTVGAPLTNYALSILSSGIWKTKDYEVNYAGKTEAGDILCSSTFFIKDEDKLIGMLCLNIKSNPQKDIETCIDTLKGLLDTHLTADSTSGKMALPVKKEEAITQNLIENFSQNISQVLKNALPEVLHTTENIPMSRLTTQEKTEIVKRLYDQGIFQIKGSIPDVAKELMVSEATIYRYLSNIQN